MGKLRGTVAANIRPQVASGAALYPAADLERIFDWADTEGRTLEWVEGIFYNPSTNEGQLSGAYICERRGADYAAFRRTCLGLVAKIEAEASTLGMEPFFEIGVSDNSN